MKSIKKSLKKSVIGISGIFLSLFLVSCTNNVSEVKDLELQTCYGKAVLGKIQFLEKTIDTVTKYVDINGSSRNAIAGDCDLLSIGEILPDDLSTLKRKKNSVKIQLQFLQSTNTV